VAILGWEEQIFLRFTEMRWTDSEKLNDRENFFMEIEEWMCEPSAVHVTTDQSLWVRDIYGYHYLYKSDANLFGILSGHWSPGRWDRFPPRLESPIQNLRSDSSDSELRMGLSPVNRQGCRRWNCDNFFLFLMFAAKDHSIRFFQAQNRNSIPPRDDPRSERNVLVS
jgi:hypothetical protein